MSETTPSQALSLPQEQIDLLKKPTPQMFIQQRKGAGGMMLSYVETGYVIAQLNKIFQHVWSFEIKSKEVMEDQVIVQGSLKVMLADGKILTQEQFGSADIKRRKDGKPLSIGDDYKAAGSDALKKCASQLGLASDVYHPRVHATVNAVKQNLKPQFSNKPASLEQIKEITRLCKKLDKTVEPVTTEQQAAQLIEQLTAEEKALSQELDTIS